MCCLKEQPSLIPALGYSTESYFCQTCKEKQWLKCFISMPFIHILLIPALGYSTRMCVLCVRKSKQTNHQSLYFQTNILNSFRLFYFIKVFLLFTYPIYRVNVTNSTFYLQVSKIAKLQRTTMTQTLLILITWILN